MALFERPNVTKREDGGKCWKHQYDSFYLKSYVPSTTIDGTVNNYGFRAPLLLVFEENKMSMDEAIKFAEENGLAKIASDYDSCVLFIYPTCEGGWEAADENLYIDLIAEVKNHPEYEDGIAEIHDFFTSEFKGFFVRGAVFRADIYSYGKSADYVATKLLKKIDGEYLWGPGEITPACCYMERLSVTPVIERKDIPVISVGNSPEINEYFKECENHLIEDSSDYVGDYNSFVRRYKMWCGKIEIEPDFEELNMTEEAGFTEVKTSPDHRGRFKGVPTHKVGYFAYYNNGIFDKGPVPLLVGFHGGGDSSMYFTFVAGWWNVCHRHDFLFVSIENHMDVSATEAVEVIEDLQKKYNIDKNRIYAAGFSMGSGKTWDLFMEYPEILAGVAPNDALFPMKNNQFGLSIDDPGINKTVSVPMYYSGGEMTPLPELPCQNEVCLDRIKYLADVNKLKADFNFGFDEQEKWADKEYCGKPDRIEKLRDETRDAILTERYYESEDGICRTVLASIDNQQHELREHTCENAWKFISQFSL
ncbi:Poly(3-hydroxybutyrate) depolymerase [Eubacterium ruminantium]|uniref:Poly(3-hydroxybutyrate) depolymerase n=1 Tax=Eubacterium ruminantium TaxID=42322 RepID=A0A1T4L0R3_9FIRM|nr:MULTISPECIES: hypothetical protein [Eubacterium]MCR5368112.1 hypothetical protein [Eubacterium sp.]SCW42523.1 Poly(3-hydroxybutyrate) depolymerase [Eubacterium ruminantium]SDN20992.1 Poly(3-hydroxybutyrate) depolymerase [Eubacterium ruminantium]SJZ48233.1 Poly(3-hydroxybutyrate) depolymerase [Eubacterium ruminantium]